MCRELKHYAQLVCDLRGGFHPVEHRHGDVHEDDVGLELALHFGDGTSPASFYAKFHSLYSFVLGGSISVGKRLGAVYSILKVRVSIRRSRRRPPIICAIFWIIANPKE